MNHRLAFGLTIARSRIHGKGCFAAIFFRQNQQIAQYVGERISLAEAERRRCASRKQCICDVDTEWAIDGSRGGNGTQYVNHSCQPNSEVIVLGGHIFLYALREIIPGEEITTDYLYELSLDGTRCNCRMTSCWKTMSTAEISTGSQRAAKRDPHESRCPQLTLLLGGACEG
jgi:SET domain-containing protein